MHESWDIQRLLKWSTDYLIKKDINAPRLTSELLLARVLNYSRLELYLHYDQPLTKKELTAFKALLKRRLVHEPLAYILGEKIFWSLGFQVTPATLIPRPETEKLVEIAIKIIKKNPALHPYILDWGTGCGAIAICLAKELPYAHIMATDISKEALECAKQNIRQHKVSVNLVKSKDLTCFKKGYFHFIVSNPPYVKTSILNTLDPEIKDYEPRCALDGGPDGLKYISYLISHCPRYLRKDGWLIMEIGYDQKEDIERLKFLNTYDPPCFFKDYSGYIRVVALKNNRSQKSEVRSQK